MPLTFLGPLSLTHLSQQLYLSMTGLLELSLQQVSSLRNSLKRQLDLVFILDPSEVTVSRIDALIVPEDRYHFTLEIKICLPCVDTISPLLFPTKSRCFGKCDCNKLNYMISQYN